VSVDTLSTEAGAGGKKPFHIPSLDGLRAVSFLIVFLGHASAKKWIPGYFGLAVFFFLSGYLITTLLRLEYDKTGTLGFRAFYERRALRIWPPFFLVLVAASALTLTGFLRNTLEWQAVLAQAVGLTNYWVVAHGWWQGMAPGTWIFWSLCVEEHFYLLFPLLYLAMRRRGLSGRQQAMVLLGLCGVVLLWRCVLVLGFHATHERIYAASDTRIDSILFGCALAVYGNPVLDFVTVSARRLASFWLPLSAVALLLSFGLAAKSFVFGHTLAYTVQGLALVPVFVAAVRFPHWALCRVLNLPWVRTVGLLSYSLYLLHPAVLFALETRTHLPSPVRGVLGLLVSLALAALIYRLVELPCARLRKKLAGLAGLKSGQGSPSPGLSGSPELGRGGRVARNVLATLGTQILSWGLTFAVTLFLPRYVGDVGLGKLAFAASFVTVLSVVVPLGTSTLLVKEIARDGARTGELLLAALLLRLPLAVLMTGAAIGLVALLGYPPQTRLLVTVAALGMVVYTVNDALGAALQGQENMPRQSVGLLADKFLASGLTIFLILRHAPLWAIASVGIWTGLVSLLVNASAFRPLLPTLRLPDLGTVKNVARAGLPFLGYTVFQTLYGQTDPIVLSLVSNDATVGWYAAAFRLVGAAFFFPTALTLALLPTLSRLHGESQAQFRQLARRMLGLVMACALPVALTLILLPDALIALLHYPPSFAHAVPVLRVGGVGVLLWFAGNALGTLIFASDGQGRMFQTSVVATLLGIPSCFLYAYLGHRFLHNGAVGAIGSDVLLEAFLLWAYVRLLPKDTLGAAAWADVGRCVLAAVPMAAVIVLLAPRGWGLWSLAPALLAYGASGWALGCFGVKDVALARQALARRGA